MKTLSRLVEGLKNYRLEGETDFPVRGLAYHSGEVVPESVFVAVKGYRTDGHLYLNDALRRGAWAVVSEHDLPLPAGVTLVRVQDARDALAYLSAAFYGHPSRELALVGITGTNGKTSTTYLLEAILTAAGHSVGVVGTVNYRVGDESLPAPVTTPESLDLQRLLRNMRNKGASHVFLEVSSHALDLKRVDHTAFAAAVFTNLSQDHLDYHRNLDDYFAVKSRLFTEILANSGGSKSLAVINLDDPRGAALAALVEVPLMTYGCAPEAMVRPRRYRCRQDGLTAVLTTPVGEMEIFSPLVGNFNLANILAASATALGLGVDPGHVAAGIANLAGVPGRMERFGPAAGPWVFVDYAHTPAALAQALAALATLDFNRLITVFGCGGDRDRSKRPLMGEAAAAAANLVIVTSDNPRSEDPLAIIQEIESGLQAQRLRRLSLAAAQQGDAGYLIVPDRRQAIQLAIALARGGDGVLVAGKGHENYQIWGTERRHFDDREEVQAALAEYHK